LDVLDIIGAIEDHEHLSPPMKRKLRKRIEHHLETVMQRLFGKKDPSQRHRTPPGLNRGYRRA